MVEIVSDVLSLAVIPQLTDRKTDQLSRILICALNLDGSRQLVRWLNTWGFNCWTKHGVATQQIQEAH
jgi:hypothetical protein